MLATAQDIDRQRERRAKEREKRAEERELRTRMAGSTGSVVEPTESDQHADVSAGMAAEAIGMPRKAWTPFSSMFIVW